MPINGKIFTAFTDLTGRMQAAANASSLAMRNMGQPSWFSVADDYTSRLKMIGDGQRDEINQAYSTGVGLTTGTSEVFAETAALQHDLLAAVARDHYSARQPRRARVGRLASAEAGIAFKDGIVAHSIVGYIQELIARNQQGLP